MAHFAELDENNVVLRVLVVDNKDILDENGQEQEAVGVQFLTNLFGHSRWKQTSYNANFRRHFAGNGHTYDSERNAFIPPKPYPSWVLDEEKLIWKTPIDEPADSGQGEGKRPYRWNEDTQEWVVIVPQSDSEGE
jgi:hypothetical protein